MTKPVVYFKAEIKYDTKGKKISAEKMARGLARQMGRQYICHKFTRLKTKTKGILITTTKGTRLTREQKKIGCKMARGG